MYLSILKLLLQVFDPFMYLHMYVCICDPYLSYHLEQVNLQKRFQPLIKTSKSITSSAMHLFRQIVKLLFTKKKIDKNPVELCICSLELSYSMPNNSATLSIWCRQ